MSPHRPVAPVSLLPLYGILECLIVFGLALKPSRYRALVFLPIALLLAWIVSLSRAYSITGTIVDVLLGAAIFFHAFYAFNGIVLTDVQRRRYRKGRNLVRSYRRLSQND